MTDLHERTHVRRDPDGKLPVDKVVFGVAAALSIAFVISGVVDPEAMGTGTTEILTWITDSFGWLFVLTSASFVIFSAYLAISRYGNIRLGPDDSEPEFSTFSWVSMMFATGMGIGLMFWGVAEPLTHLNTPPMGMAEPATPEAANLAMEYTFFHWGFHPWSMYAVIGLAIGYFAYRKGTGNLVSGAFRPLLGDRAAGGPGQGDRRDRDLRDALRVGHLTGPGGAADHRRHRQRVRAGRGQQGAGGRGDRGPDRSASWSPRSRASSEGVKYLSNANAVAAGLLALFLFVVGPTVFILGTFTESMGGYLTHLPTMSFRTGVFGDSAWLNGWTIFYWAWWVSWTPFVGMFIARISKGRTIRQFVIFVILVPSLVSFVWFSIMGGAAFDLQLRQGVDMPALARGRVGERAVRHPPRVPARPGSRSGSPSS